MTKALNSVVGINSLAIMLLIGVIASVTLFEKPFLSYPQLPFKVRTSKIHPGDVVEVEAYRCSASREAETYLLTHQLVSDDTGEAFILTGTQVEVAPGCSTASSRVNVVPKDARPGRYHFAGAARVDGTVRNFSVRWFSESFEVMK